MADDDSRSGLGRPSLEPPRLFGRRKRDADAAPESLVEDVADGADGTQDVEPDATAILEDAEHDVPVPTSVSPEPASPARQRLRRPRVPVLDGRVVAAISGLISGLVLGGLTAGFLKVCSEVRDSTSCGKGAGSILLLVVLIATILVGRMLLALGRVPEPGSTSFLAIGLVGVVSLLFFVDVLDTWPMLIALPLLTALAFVVSWWMTTTYVDPDPTEPSA